MGKSKGRVRIKQIGGGGGTNAAAAAAAASLFQNPLEGLPPEQMMQWIQPKPDPSFQMIWPLTETFSMTYTSFSILYPNYLDGRKTMKQGRRIARAHAVPPPLCPLISEMQQALQMLGVRHVVQPYKGYSRDAVSRWENPGRVLVDLESYHPTTTSYNDHDDDDDDDPPELVDGDDYHHHSGGDGVAMKKKTLLRDLARCIRQLPSRQERLQRDAEEQRKALEQQQQQLQLQQQQQHALVQKKTATTSTTSSSSDASTNKKKNKGNNKKKK